MKPRRAWAWLLVVLAVQPVVAADEEAPAEREFSERISVMAIEIQREFRNESVWHAEDDPLAFRIGINLGEVLMGDSDVHGHSVNVAARIQALARPGGICVTEEVRRAVRRQVHAQPQQRVEHRAGAARQITMPVILPSNTSLPSTTPWHAVTKRRRPDLICRVSRYSASPGTTCPRG